MLTGAEMTRRAEAWVRRVDQEFASWERVRRRLVERERRFAAAVTGSADTCRLATLRREVADLRLALDEVFGRAMRVLEQAGGASMAE